MRERATTVTESPRRGSAGHADRARSPGAGERSRPTARTRIAVLVDRLTPHLQHHLLLAARGCRGRRWITFKNLAAQLRMERGTLVAAIGACAASGLLRCSHGFAKGRLSLTRAGRRSLDQLEQWHQAEILALQYQLPLPPSIGRGEGQTQAQSTGEKFMLRQDSDSHQRRPVRPAAHALSRFATLHRRASAKLDALMNRLLWTWLSLFAMPQSIEASLNDKPASPRRARGVHGRHSGR